MGIPILLSLTACTGDLDDPFGAKQRLAEERRAECQRIYDITEAHNENTLAVYRGNLAPDGTQTREGLLKVAEVPLQTADLLEALKVEEQNLKSLSLELATGLRQLAAAERTLAPFADVERTITSANDRSPAHQASVVQRDEASSHYGGILRALEFYCEGGDLPSSMENSAE
ncbi:MAG: hypothetical protein F6J95_025815 [Leptolyngbya sp. SIO1E4]|nr:hypothetical protein [Leptolyngbya sp. SIO1E4]